MCFRFLLSFSGHGRLLTRSSVALCGVYYFVWIKVLPKRGGYQFRQTIIQLDGGATAHQLVKVPNDQLAEWDAEHDATGRVRRRIPHDVDTKA